MVTLTTEVFIHDEKALSVSLEIRWSGLEQSLFKFIQLELELELLSHNDPGSSCNLGRHTWAVACLIDINRAACGERSLLYSIILSSHMLCSGYAVSQGAEADRPFPKPSRQSQYPMNYEAPSLRNGLRYDLSQDEWYFRHIEFAMISLTLQVDVHNKLSGMRATQDVKAAMKLDSSAAFWVDKSKAATSDWDDKHKRGWRLWVKRYQDFSKAASKFLQDFGPIVAIVKAAGPYGELAIGIISVLFTVAESKSDIDDLIASTIASIKDRLPGFRMYQEIFAEEDEHQRRLIKKIMLAYASIMELTIQAVQHYLQQSFKQMADNVQLAILDVRLQCEEVTIKNVNDIRQQNERLTKMVARLEEDNGNRNLLTIQSRTPKSWTTTTLALSLIARIKACLYHEQYFFQAWKSSQEPAVLIIVGRNYLSLARHCWMSPVAICLVRELGSQSQACASYIFDISRGANTHDAVPELLLQLLRWRKSALGEGDFLNALCATIEKYTYMHERGNALPSAVYQVLGEIAMMTLGLFAREETVYIVLDRVDRCHSTSRGRKELLELCCCVKVLVMASSFDGDVEWCEESLPPKCSRCNFKQVEEVQELVR
ncbi:uncharacterized protein MYCFIDRAFT_177748 [Pseudocercospora fijiensis CIRAD86]|uniref:DUF7708 domain-containing protein n=1 Tax=Pseudocercospora fijiensis (strain CIRAD86) TaxID=383855 RepID=M2YMW6_PSEFD|nr:uncharacterized protein MYCFIDRAFT_177748 [Pseudocercospora fijiensis CIRAD86]EME79080.1 hypothetical protein MYCFIDRAFT_177748 [Pseudocercospora fijiensis CIRAD86]